uniref:CSON003563 protein n=1 Tax=Culicoides sonorensis TaxID=179676 RepID=A0A336MSV6_CULSO
MMKSDSQKLLTCPYNDSHQILLYRFQKHLVKCARQHPHIKLEVCPFNASHRIRPAQFQAHKIDCPDRLKFETYMNVFQDGICKKEQKTEIKYPEYKDNESWDDMVGQGGYDPKAATDCKPVLRRIIGATSTEKRAFYSQEHKRLKMLRDLENGKIVIKEEPDIKKEKQEKDPKDNYKFLPYLKREQTYSESKSEDERNSNQIKPPSVKIKSEHPIKQEPVEIQQEKDTSPAPIKVKKEFKCDIQVKQENSEDELVRLYKKRQRELQKIIRQLQAKEPNLEDPRLQIEERERSLSPIFDDVQNDARLKINPFSLMKGKENYRDPRLKSIEKREQDKLKQILEQNLIVKTEPTEEITIKSEINDDQSILLDIEILDQLIDEAEAPKQITPVPEEFEANTAKETSQQTPTKVRLRSISTCSNESKESGEVTDSDEDENCESKISPNKRIVDIDDDTELTNFLNSAEFNELKQCAVTVSSDTESSSSSMKRKSSQSDINLINTLDDAQAKKLSKKISPQVYSDSDLDNEFRVVVARMMVVLRNLYLVRHKVHSIMNGLSFPKALRHNLMAALVVEGESVVAIQEYSQQLDFLSVLLVVLVLPVNVPI